MKKTLYTKQIISFAKNNINIRKYKIIMRRTFEFQGQPIRAAGIIFYVNYNGKREYLLRRVGKKWGDLGGKTDYHDINAEYTAIREVAEETNNRLFGEHTQLECMLFIKKYINNGRKIYRKNCKYMLFIVKLPKWVREMDLGRFGNKEELDNLEHEFGWFSDISKLDIHPRLYGIKLYGYITNIVEKNYISNNSNSDNTNSGNTECKYG